jgi:hypothetical protein
MPLHLGHALLTRASSILTREAARISSIVPTDFAPAHVPQASSPLSAADAQRQTLELVQGIFTLLAAERGAGTAAGTSQVPLIACAALVEPGTEAVATLRVANEEALAADISLYTTNFVADSGYEIPSIAVRISPRKVNVAAGGEEAFEIRIAVPSQTPKGMYSGLVQATNSRYVKAVIVFDVM